MTWEELKEKAKEMGYKFNVAQYFSTGLTEVIIPIPKDMRSDVAIRKIKSYCYRARQNAKVTILYACTPDGIGVLLACCHLKSPIELKQRGRKPTGKNDLQVSAKNAHTEEIGNKFLDDITDEECEALASAYGCQKLQEEQ
ncbi:MAG: hypothetical protein J6S85_05805 [Methanobrevibacter sp.]|nr:hypothetical protein [Methanobrevibacter sp.]